MSKEKVNGVESTLPQRSESEVVQVKEGIVEVVSHYNSPKTSKETWTKIRFKYEAGTYRSLKELASKYGVNFKTLQSRMNREGWKEKREALLSKVEAKVHGTVLKELSEQESYLKRSYLRSQRYEKLIDASLSQLATTPEGVPMAEPADIDTLTRSEMRIAELSRIALRIPVLSALDITTGGASLGESFVQAIAKLRSEGQPKLSGEDLSKVLEAEVE